MKRSQFVSCVIVVGFAVLLGCKPPKYHGVIISKVKGSQTANLDPYGNPLPVPQPGTPPAEIAPPVVTAPPVANPPGDIVPGTNNPYLNNPGGVPGGAFPWFGSGGIGGFIAATPFGRIIDSIYRFKTGLWTGFCGSHEPVPPVFVPVAPYGVPAAPYGVP